MNNCNGINLQVFNLNPKIDLPENNLIVKKTWYLSFLKKSFLSTIYFLALCKGKVYLPSIQHAFHIYNVLLGVQISRQKPNEQLKILTPRFVYFLVLYMILLRAKHGARYGKCWFMLRYESTFPIWNSCTLKKKKAGVLTTFFF